MHMFHSLIEVFGTGVIPNPPAQAIPGAAKQISDIVAYVKWGALLVIILVGFIGAGAVAGGRAFANHQSSKAGQGMLISAVIGAVLYACIYAFLTSVTG
jgi:hypothetical protein